MDLVLAARLLDYRARLHRHEHWTRAELDAYRAGQLRELRQHALAHSPFYRRFHKGLEDAPLEALPVLTKAQLMAEFDDVVTDREFTVAAARRHVAEAPAEQLFLDRYRLCASSGTSGEPGIFPYDEVEWAWILASYSRANRWAGIPSGVFHQLRLAMIGSTRIWHQSSAVIDTLNSAWVPSLRLRSTDPIETLCEELDRWQPRLLITYASMAGALAEEQLAGRLSIAPQAVMCVAEPLNAQTRSLVKRGFGSEPFENYAATETGAIAADCRLHDGLHLYEDLLIIENVDENNRPVPAGRMGAKLLVSVLFSRTLPLIRYELDDSLTINDTPCACGLPFRRIARIGGRIAETLRIPRKDGSTAIIHPTHFEDLVAPTDIRSYQVFYDGQSLNIRLLKPVTDETRRLYEARLEEFVKRERIDFLALDVEVVDAIARTPAGKMILIGDLTRKA